jgi:hypothetical protein
VIGYQEECNKGLGLVGGNRRVRRGQAVKQEREGWAVGPLGVTKSGAVEGRVKERGEERGGGRARKREKEGARRATRKERKRGVGIASVDSR